MAGTHRRRVRACRARVTRVVDAIGYTDHRVRDLMAAALLVRNTFFEWGPTDDGTTQGKAFEDALMELNREMQRLGF